ncbi:uncharacterized protein At5g41620-like [Curcuma longa]|uniref:uncharacterized protein At5g41620-like n=1 Tax=Curcuma longa TaxID=136217 RepID=UPI003D9F2EC8
MEGDKAAAAAAASAIDDGEENSGTKDAPLGVKLRRVVSVCKRGGLCTPPPSWKLEEPGPPDLHEAEPSRRFVSARKLGAGLWEIQDLLSMSATSRRHSRVRHHRRDGKALMDRPDPSTSRGHEDWPQSAGSLRKHIEASLNRHLNLKEKNTQILQPFSPTYYASSSKDKLGDEGYRLKTSTELLKVFNHIWSLEEQNESSAALVKALKVELEHAHAQLEELMQEKHAYRSEIDHLVEQMNEASIAEKNKEQHKIKAVVQSLRDDLEDERRLRRRSENLHRKLGKELSQAKTTMVKAAKDLVNLRKTNILLDDLCGAFAEGINDYEYEVRLSRQKSSNVCDSKVDSLLLHISEAWLDEREQMRDAESQIDDRNLVIDRLRSEIEAFIQASRSNGLVNGNSFVKYGKQENKVRRQSLESMHLNGTSAPQDADDDDDEELDSSVESDLHCFELNMSSNRDNIDQLNHNGQNITAKLDSSRKPNTFEEKIGFSDKIKNNQISTHLDTTKPKEEKDESGFYGIQMQFLNGEQRKDPSKTVESNGTARNKTEESKTIASGGLQDESTSTRECSDWHKSQFSKPRFSEKLADASVDTLKVRLLEARLEGQQARLKAARGSSVGARQG